MKHFLSSAALVLAVWALSSAAAQAQTPSTDGAVLAQPVAVEQGRPHLRDSVTFAPAAAW